MRIDVISEFLLSYPILSFGIVTAKRDYFSDEAIAAFENGIMCFYSSHLILFSFLLRRDIEFCILLL